MLLRVGLFLAGLIAVTSTRPASVAAQESTRADHAIRPLGVDDSIPSIAPDTVPAWFHHDSSYTTGEPSHLKHVLGVVFDASADQAARQAAVDSVRGRVVGGWRLSPVREGIYAVEVVDGGRVTRLYDLMQRLQAFPQVKSATRIFQVTVN